ncbi:MAG: cyanophycinase [Tepidanaerobacteraceae bacterium]|nr:cyanophycinase [Tepidanaerobacteraceae bacterium]
MIIGGAEDKDGECIILKKVVELSGGAKARIAVITAAAKDARRVGESYGAVFKKLGAGDIDIVNIETRKDAFRGEIIDSIADSTGIFFTGGDQLRITSLLGGSLVYHALHAAYDNGVLIAGTSAGASAMSDIMLVGGDGDQAPKKNAISMAPGIGLLEEVVIDQHFAQRGRIGRLLLAVAQNPYVLGVGIDEDTAVLLNPDATFAVVGSQTVTVVDGMDAEYTNVSELSPGEPLNLFGARIHVLSSGARFNLKTRKPFSKFEV